MENIYKVLQDLNIDYVKHEHPAVFTCKEADHYYKNVAGAKSKNLFLKDRKGNYFLVILESSKQLALNSLAVKLGVKKLSFASEERLREVLGLTKGSVSPFGLISDTEKKTVVVIDQALWHTERLHFHPNVNTATLELSRENFEKFLNWCGNKLKILEL